MVEVRSGGWLFERCAESPANGAFQISMFCWPMGGGPRDRVRVARAAVFAYPFKKT